MHNTLSLANASEILQHYGLLREMIQYGKAEDTNSANGANTKEKTIDSTHSRNEIWSLNPYYFSNIDADKCFTNATYDTRDIKSGTLLFIKGNFKSEYLLDADNKGLTAYVAEQSYAQYTKAVGLIVTDAKKAMSVLAAAFFEIHKKNSLLLELLELKAKQLQPTLLTLS